MGLSKNLENQNNAEDKNPTDLTFTLLHIIRAYFSPLFYQSINHSGDNFYQVGKSISSEIKQ